MEQNRTTAEGAAQRIKARILTRFKKTRIYSYLGHKKALLYNEPWWGIKGGIRPDSNRGERIACMQNFIKQEIEKNRGQFFKILEIGSWLGGSAIVWADAIKKYNEGKGLVICVDPWIPYISTENIGISSTPHIMNEALKKNQVFPLFLNNVRSFGMENIIKPYRGTSDELLPTLREKSFNFVYVDGSHFYSQVIKDLKLCECLVSENGVFGGDDLELQVDEIDMENAEKQKEKDYILDTKTNKPFHPGVSIAVGEFFSKTVSSYDGFWVMRKTQDEWQQVKIS